MSSLLHMQQAHAWTACSSWGVVVILGAHTMHSPEGQHSINLQLIIRVHQDEVLGIQNAHNVLTAALIHRYAREACNAADVNLQLLALEQMSCTIQKIPI